MCICVCVCACACLFVCVCLCVCVCACDAPPCQHTSSSNASPNASSTSRRSMIPALLSCSTSTHLPVQYLLQCEQNDYTITPPRTCTCPCSACCHANRMITPGQTSPQAWHGVYYSNDKGCWTKSIIRV